MVIKIMVLDSSYSHSFISLKNTSMAVAENGQNLSSFHDAGKLFPSHGSFIPRATLQATQTRPPCQQDADRIFVISYYLQDGAEQVGSVFKTRARGFPRSYDLFCSSTHC